MKHSPHMQAALEEAHKAYDNDEIPIGAVIVDSATGEIIARSGNRTEELSNPIAHAEMLGYRRSLPHKRRKTPYRLRYIHNAGTMPYVCSGYSFRPLASCLFWSE